MQQIIEFQNNANVKPKIKHELLQMSYEDDRLLGMHTVMKGMEGGRNVVWVMLQLKFRHGA